MMRKKLTLTVEKQVYEGLHTVIGRGVTSAGLSAHWFVLTC